jgi:superfamily II DNA or RNA helicase
MVDNLRPYQSSAVEKVRAHWANDVNAVCLVAPTGSGKTRIGEELVNDDGETLWIAHRRELIIQTAKRLRLRFGKRNVGIIMPGEYETPNARVKVATVQTLLARGELPQFRKLVLDEAHHYMAEDWRRIVRPGVQTLGLTATPERGDGEPLGDIFSELVVAANYSELIRDGFLVPVRMYQPVKNLHQHLVKDPFEVWRDLSEGSQAFVFCARVAIAEELAQRFRDNGVSAECIEANTSKGERDDAMERFARGTLRVIVNVNTMTEGVDVPEVRTIILARLFGHVGEYLQAVGRGLRVAKGKPDAIVIDLTGCSLRHGLPSEDRVYSLTGKPISEGKVFGGGGRAPPFVQDVKGGELRMVSPGAYVPGNETRGELPSSEDISKRALFYSKMRKAGVPKILAAKQFHEKFGVWPEEQ